MRTGNPRWWRSTLVTNNNNNNDDDKDHIQYIHQLAPRQNHKFLHSTSLILSIQINTTKRNVTKA